MVKSGFIWIFVALAALSEVHGQMPGFGKCPNITVVQNVDTLRILGVWYQVERYLSIVEAFTSCKTATYGTNVTTANNITHIPLTYQQKAAQVDFLVRGNVDIDVKGVFRTDFDLKLGVPKDFVYIELDYDNYAIAYHCDDYFGLYHTETLWIYTRSKEPSSLILDKAHQAIDREKLSKLLLVKSSQENCAPPKC